MTDINAFEALMAEIEGKPPETESSVAEEEPDVSSDTKTGTASQDLKEDPRKVRAAVVGVLGFMHADLGRGAPADGSDWREAYGAAAQALADAIGWEQQRENRES